MAVTFETVPTARWFRQRASSRAQPPHTAAAGAGQWQPPPEGSASPARAVRAYAFRACAARCERAAAEGFACAESFFATFKKELVRDRDFPTRAHAGSETFEYIEVFYNRQKAHSLLGYATPSAFEDCFEKKNAA